MKTLGPAARQARALARLTGVSLWRGFVGFYNSDNLTYAASIAYYALLSLFPFSMLGFAVLGSVTADEHDRSDRSDVRPSLLPRAVRFHHQQLDAFRGESASRSASPARIALVWGALGVFGAISTAVNYAWGVEKTRSFWKHKLFSFLMLLVAGA